MKMILAFIYVLLLYLGSTVHAWANALIIGSAMIAIIMGASLRAWVDDVLPDRISNFITDHFEAYTNVWIVVIVNFLLLVVIHFIQNA